MLYVSIFVELLRSRPALAVWLAALSQALLWLIVPAVFYEGPPGELPFTLAIGHEFQLGTYRGPPLSFWLAEIAYLLFGGSVIGPYLLSQICVVVTFWSVFLLGKSILGAQHAALAVLLMVGILAFSIPTPDFGPVPLTMALWSLILLHYWRAVGEGRRGYWVAIAIESGLLLLTSYAGLLLLVALVMFTLINRQARAALRSSDPWFALLAAAVVLAPHLIWLAESEQGLASMLRLRADGILGSVLSWVRQLALVLGVHIGVATLIAALVGWPWTKHELSPVIVRAPVSLFARQFVIYFALAPALLSTVFAVLGGWSEPLAGIAPLVVLSGPLVILLAGDAIELRQQLVLIPTWFGLLLAPPALAILGVLTLPWIGIDLNVNKPARQMAQFFADSFARRTGAPLPIVAGDPRTAALIALGPSRPTLFLDATPERTPWVTFDDIRAKGGLVVWPTTDTAGTPPPELKQRFPDLVPEVPQDFERPIQGRLPTLRIGWGLIRPQRDVQESKPESKPQPAPQSAPAQ